MKKHYLLIPLILALALTACTADAVQETAVSTVEEAAAKAAAQVAPSTVPKDAAIPTEQAPPTAVSQAAASQSEEAPAAAVLPVLGPAPAWDNEVWINSETPLPLEELRGKVVLLEFWTFG